MSMDAARMRFPECPECGCGVDENDPDFTATMYQGQWYHPICLQESGIDVERGRSLPQEFKRGDKVRRIDEPQSVLWVREVDPYGKLDGTGKVLCFNSYGHGQWIFINTLELAL